MALSEKERNDFIASLKDSSVAELRVAFNKHLEKAQTPGLSQADQERESEKASIAVALAFTHKR